jgi:DNA-directed RNA polymerase specialized sigma24 family protein
MRSVYDSTDFAGDAWKSLVAKADRFDFPTIGHLMAFLTQVAQRKLIDANRRQHTLKNDTDRDRPIMVGGDHNGLREPSSNAPPISQVAVAREILDRLRSGLGEPGRTIIELKWRGYSNEEVAIRIGWHLRKVQRFLKDLHDSRLRPAPGEEAEHRDLEEAIAALDAVHEPVPGAEPGGPISGATSI